jgi:CRISPR-associated endonuclease/helicase Cas3
MKGAPTRQQFWGKLARATNTPDSPVVEWHPLIHHCADVAAVTEALLSYTKLGERLARIAGTEKLNGRTVARLCVIAALHDIGKCCQGFQNKAFTGALRAGHVGEAAWLLRSESEICRLQAHLPITEIAGWHEDRALALWLAAICHHGRPVHWDGCPDSAHHWQSSEDRDPYAGLRELSDAVRRWYPIAFEEGDKLPRGEEFQHAFAGLVMLADWLGSNRDPALFAYADSVDEDRIDFARERAARALQLVGLDVSIARNAIRGIDADAAFERIKPPYVSRANAMQQQVGELVGRKGPTVTVLESETGSGKTEAALLRFVRLFEAGEVDGMYFALPTRTAATQLFERVRDSVARLFVDEASRPPTLLAVPGYMRVDDRSGRMLTGFEALWNDDPKRAFRFRGWAAENSKRYLAGAIIVGTVDQVLLSALSVDHAHLRATALSRLLLVVDEVHASDAYMSRLLEHVLAAHARAGGHTLLMSATLATNALEQWLVAAGSRVGGGISRAAAVPLDIALERPYPSIAHWEAGRRDAPKGLDGARDRGPIHCTMQPWIDDDARIARAAIDAGREGARVVILRNTVNAAIATQRELEQAARDAGCVDLLFSIDGEPTLHHSRFAREDRERLDRALEETFGKKSTRSGVVVVATQTIQQSLDIDADLLLTDICPMDVLLQRIGRVHRHVRVRVPGCEFARIIVLVPQEGDVERYLPERVRVRRNGLGTGSVYTDLRVVQATIEELRSLNNGILSIPKDNRRLVERSLHGDVLRRINDRDEKWKRHAASSLGASLADRRFADFGALQRHVEFGEFAFPTDDDKLRALRTRLGEEDREVEFDGVVRGAFGEQIKRMRVPAWMSRDVVSEADGGIRVAVEERGANRLGIIVGCVRFAYDRLGLRWDDDDADERGAVDDE